jgi:23S rRNA pseudouridine1911/1915/1917 synthase
LAHSARSFSEVLNVKGRQPWEGGLIHRLDFATEGLVLIARNQSAFDRLFAFQEEGRLLKEYSAVSRLPPPPAVPLPGFPPPPAGIFGPAGRFGAIPVSTSAASAPPSPGAGPGAPATGPGAPGTLPVIASGFRPWGPGRRAVRPVPASGPAEPALPSRRNSRETAWDRGAPYRTEIHAVETRGASIRFTLRIVRGFRHQIRCHLAWLGFPLINDALYSGPPAPGDPSGAAAFDTAPPAIALRAHTLRFPDPRTGVEREYRIDPIPYPSTAFRISAAR